LFLHHALRGFHTSDLRFWRTSSLLVGVLVGVMDTSTLIERLRARWRNFTAARGGNVVLTFALSAIPIFGLVGAAVDYSRANSAKAAMQAATLH
jgi:hypothetical protein